MASEFPTVEAFLAENAALQIRLQEAEQTLLAIRSGEVDALVVESASGPKIFTLQGLDAELNRFRGEILEQVGDAVIVLDDDHRITYLNIAAGQQYGIDIAKMLGHPLAEMYQTRWIHPEDEAKAKHALAKTDGSWVGENIHIKRNGEAINAEISLSRLRRNSGILAVIRDVTPRKQAEIKLSLAAEADAFCIALSDALRPLSDPREIQAKANLMLGEFLHADHVLYAEVIEKGTVGWVFADYGAGAPSVMGRHRLDHFGPAVMAEIRAGRTVAVANVNKDARLKPAENSLMAKLGMQACTLVPLVKRQQLAGLLVVQQIEPRDWTAAEVRHIEEVAGRTWEAVDRGILENKMRSSEARLAAIVQQASAGLIETDLSGRILLVNDHFCEMVGRQRNELLALRWQDITYPDDLAESQIRFQRCASEGKGFSSEKRYLRPDGGQVWIRNNVSLLREANGQAMSILSVSFDIGERKQNEMRLQEQAELLSKADKHKDEFLAMLAHELRNPLAPIRNAVEIQKIANADLSRLAWCTNVIDRQLTHLTGLVDDLLDVSRISLGLIELNPEILEISDIIKPAVETNQPLIDKRRQQFYVTLPPQPLWVKGDRIRLAQVLANLINNAAKYTHEEGTIQLAAELAGDSICFRVTDNGYGIDQNSIAYLFNLFYRDGNLDHSQGGLGIGLSLVRKLVEMHGGDVKVSSPGRGKGSEFAVRLPRVIPCETGMASNTEPSASPLKRRILVVDDNPDIAESMAMLLEMDGHQVTIAYDGTTAQEVARTERPDTILLDIGLPGKTGYTVAKELRRNSEHAQTLLIAITGYGQIEDQEKSRLAGFDAHLTKPIDYEILRKLLNGHQAA